MFDKDFLWGAATASYQVEGAAYEDGKGLSVWDVFGKTQGKVYNMDTGDFACDSYHKIEEDVRLMKGLGIKAYRFSISWPRVMPKGIGDINEAGMAYYERFVDALLEAGITPYITLFHWDYPYELYKKGQWLNDASSDWFEAYTRVVVGRLGDRVKHWMTLNEPQCFIGLGYQTGVHAPGHRYPKYDIVRMSHNVNLAHGKAVRAIREIVGEEAKVGMAYVATLCYPKTDTPEDIEAARRFTFENRRYNRDWDGDNFCFDNDYWYDPILLGKYPDWVMAELSDWLPQGKALEEDMAIINSDLDFIGLNIYQGPMVEDDQGAIKLSPMPEGHAVTALNWLVAEKIMYWGTKFMYERYKKPIFITENGLSSKDWVALDGKVHDEGRVDFLTRYLRELERSKQDGVDIQGYFQWSLFDNFEWAEGYKERFGLIHVDFTSGKRTPKESYYWYKKLIGGSK